MYAGWETHGHFSVLPLTLTLRGLVGSLAVYFPGERGMGGLPLREGLPLVSLAPLGLWSHPSARGAVFSDVTHCHRALRVISPAER